MKGQHLPNKPKFQFGIAGALVVVLFQNTLAAAQIDTSAAYFCSVEMAGGISYNQQLRKWEGAKFQPDGSFVLKMQFLRNRQIPALFDKTKTERVSDFKVTIIPKGTSTERPCYSSGTENRYEVAVYGSNYVSCSSSFTDYQFDLNTNRFLGAYLIGYLEGKDSNTDTPSVAGGTCTKVN